LNADGTVSLPRTPGDASARAGRSGKSGPSPSVETGEQADTGRSTSVEECTDVFHHLHGRAVLTALRRRRPRHRWRHPAPTSSGDTASPVEGDRHRRSKPSSVTGWLDRARQARPGSRRLRPGQV